MQVNNRHENHTKIEGHQVEYYVYILDTMTTKKDNLGLSMPCECGMSVAIA